MNDAANGDDRSRLEELFARAIGLSAGAQDDYLRRACGDDPGLHQELRRLLAAHAGEDHLLRLMLAPLDAGMTGMLLGAYEVLEKLGEGGMGTVYAARQRTPGARRVALKLIRPGMDSAEVRMRFAAERQAQARLAHRNVAQVYDGGTTPDGRPFFAMELVAGGAVTSYCDQHRLTTRARLELMLQVCNGVQHAHFRGLVHRDLKPSNLLITEQDGLATLKIIDFGVALATTGRVIKGAPRMQRGQIFGTFGYMSPEQADPAGADVDLRSDIYSLGVVLYQLLSGRLPIRDPGEGGQTPHRQLARDLDRICTKAREKDPARRYQSVAELADDVRRHIARRPVAAGRRVRGIGPAGSRPGIGAASPPVR